MVKFFLATLFILFTLSLQQRLWRGDGGIEQVKEYRQQLDILKKEVNENKERNEALYGEVLNLRNGSEAIEERARHELGMIKENETFFQVID